VIPWLIAFASIAADVPPPSAGGPAVVVTQADESAFPEIRVYYEMRRPDGTFVRDARREDFRVTEDGRDRPIVGFEAPITVQARATTVVLVVDRSGSMRQGGKLDGMKRAVGTFLDGLPGGSRVALIAFGSGVDLACPFTTDMARVRDAVAAIEPEGATRYYDAVAAGIGLLEGETGRRAILALTDGQDTASRLPIEAPIAEARRRSVPVHTLGLGEPGEIDDEALDRIATETRGRSYRARDAEGLKAIYQELAERIGSSYSLSYQTDRKIPDGTFRPIRVYYAFAEGEKAGEAGVFIRGMVVPAPGWPGLFLVLVVGLSALALLPGLLAQRGRARDPAPSTGQAPTR